MKMRHISVRVESLNKSLPGDLHTPAASCSFIARDMMTLHRAAKIAYLVKFWQKPAFAEDNVAN